MPEDGKFCPYCRTRQEREPRKALKRANGAGTVYKLQGRRIRPRAAAKNRTIKDTMKPKSPLWRH